jgi:hypothetical protein
MDCEALNHIRGVLDDVEAQTDDLRDGQLWTNNVLDDLRQQRTPDNTELVERLQWLEDLINRLAEAQTQRHPRVPTPVESLFVERFKFFHTRPIKRADGICPQLIHGDHIHHLAPRSSRTRWEMEAKGHLTLEGCIEMAWMMGYIKYFDGSLEDGTLRVGWVDAKTRDPGPCQRQGRP